MIYAHALNTVSRSVGYKDYNDALHNPHSLQITFVEWKARLAAQFAMDEDELLSEDEWSEWYAKLLVPRGRAAIQASAESQRSQDVSPVQVDQDANEIPADIDHERTIVDFLQARGGRLPGRRSRSGRP